MLFIDVITDKCNTFIAKLTHMNRATISGDIIAYTSLCDDDKVKIGNLLEDLFLELKSKFDVFGRIIKGDYLECYIPDPSYALRIALIIKSHVKSYALELSDSKNKRFNAFKTYGIRLAIGIGEISRFDLEKGIIDGEAIYFSGRTINDINATYDKERIVIKNTLFIKTNNEKSNSGFDSLLSLIDVLISKSTAKQSNILYLKLMGNSELEIAEKMNLFQSTVNEHSTSLGWNAIEKAVLYFEDFWKMEQE